MSIDFVSSLLSVYFLTLISYLVADPATSLLPLFLPFSLLFALRYFFLIFCKTPSILSI
jgi:hypothetical protein